MALCPNCKKEVNGENIVREQLRRSLKEIGIHTYMYSCPHCHIILGITKVTSY